MSADRRRTGSEGSLEGIREASDAVQKSTAQIVAEKTVERWQMVGAVVVLALTSYFLYRLDGTLTTDAIVFTGLSVALLAYFLVTLRTDVGME